MLPGPGCAGHNPGAFGGWIKPKARPGAAGALCVSPYGAQRAIMRGRGGLHAPEHPPAPTCCSLGCEQCEPSVPPAAEGMNLGSASTTSPAQGHPLGSKSKGIHHQAPPCKQTSPCCSRGRFWDELHPAALIPAGMGEGRACFGSWMGAWARRQQPHT